MTNSGSVEMARRETHRTILQGLAATPPLPCGVGQRPRLQLLDSTQWVSMWVHESLVSYATQLHMVLATGFLPVRRDDQF